MKKSPKCFCDYVKKYNKLPRSTKDLMPTLKSFIRMVVPCSVATAERKRLKAKCAFESTCAILRCVSQSKAHSAMCRTKASESDYQ